MVPRWSVRSARLLSACGLLHLWQRECGLGAVLLAVLASACCCPARVVHCAADAAHGSTRCTLCRGLDAAVHTFPLHLQHPWLCENCDRQLRCMVGCKERVAAACASLLHTMQGKPDCAGPPAAVSAYVTHGVFPKQSWAKFKADNGGEWSALVPVACGLCL